MGAPELQLLSLLSKHILHEIERQRAPGVSVAWACENGAVGTYVAGAARLNPRVDATPATCYPWFSVTKLFTATAVLQLVAAGRVALDEPVATYIAGLPVGAHGELTPRQLLSHTSGLANPLPLNWVHEPTEPGPGLEAMTRRLLGAHPRLRFRPGSRYAYSNLGYLVLGLLIEQTSGMPYEAYIATRVLTPLDASDSSFELPVASAHGYSRTWSPMSLIGRALLRRSMFGPTHGGYTELRPFLLDGAPYGGLVGTATDMLQLGRAMLGDGRSAGGTVLEPALVRLALAPTRGRNGTDLAIGLGWHLGVWRGEPYAHHIGGGAGFRCELRVFPRVRTAIAVIANETSFDTVAVTRMAAALGEHVSGEARS